MKIMHITNDVNVKVRTLIMEMNKHYIFTFHIEKLSDRYTFTIPKPLKSNLVEIQCIPTQDKESLGEYIECELILNEEIIGRVRDVPPPYETKTLEIKNNDFININLTTKVCDYSGDVSIGLIFK